MKISSAFFSRTILLGLVSLMAFPLAAQQTFRVLESSTFTVLGTSTLHDWEAKATDISGTVQMNNDFLKKSTPKTGTTIDAVSLKIGSASLESGRGETMNGKIRKALKSDANPHIIYELILAEVTGVSDKSEGIVDIATKGKLTIGGTTREIEMNLKGQKQADGAYKFFGSKPLKMTTWELVPPSAMFGQIQTGDEISVRFELLASGAAE